MNPPHKAPLVVERASPQQPEILANSPEPANMVTPAPRLGAALRHPTAGRARTASAAAVAGNAATARTIWDQPPLVTSAEMAPVKDVDRYTRQLNFVCVFQAYDLYAQKALQFAKVVWPEHVLITANTMEEAIIKMRDKAKAIEHASSKERASNAAMAIAQVVLVTHGTPDGRLKVPLVRGRKGTTTGEIIQLQKEFKEGAHKTFQRARSELLSRFDERTEVVVRTCRAGRVPQLVNALAAFFGGQATVYVPTAFQAFTDVLEPDYEKAYNHLVAQGYLPDETTQKLEDKKEWVRKHLPRGRVPEMFFVTDDEQVETRVRGKDPDDPDVQSLKDFASASAVGGDHWATGTIYPGESDRDLDGLMADDIVGLAKEYLASLRALEERQPENWKEIAESAWMVWRCHKAWLRKNPPAIMDTDDPLLPAGLTMPGLQYDPDDLFAQARRRRDLVIPPQDVFLSTKLEPQFETPAEEYEDPFGPPTPAPAVEATPTEDHDDPYAEDEPAKQVDSGADEDPYAEGYPLPAPVSSDTGPDPYAEETPAPSTAPAASPKKRPTRPRGDRKPSEIVTPDNAPLVLPPLPEPALRMAEPAGNEPVTIKPGAGFKRTFEIRWDRKVLKDFVKISGVTIDIDGSCWWVGPAAEKTINLQALGGTLMTRAGEKLYGGAQKIEGVLSETTSESGVSTKVKVGTEFGDKTRTTTPPGGDPTSTYGAKRDYLYISCELGWGPFLWDFKLVVIGVDETRSGLDRYRILTVKLPMAGLHGKFPIRLDDGTSVEFTGKVTLSIEGAPNLEKIAPWLAAKLGQTTLLPAAGEILAATGAAEVAVITGFGAALIATVYSYCQSMNDINDLNELSKAGDQGVTDFIGGYLAANGLPTQGANKSGALYAEGQRHGELYFNAQAARHTILWNRMNPGQQVTEKEMAQGILSALPSTPGKVAYIERWRARLYNAYSRAIRSLIYHSWRQHNDDRDYVQQNEKFARTKLGLPDQGPLPEEPDWGQLY